MKSEQTIARAFKAMQAICHKGHALGLSPTVATTHKLITLAWILDMMPPHMDEVTSQHNLHPTDQGTAHLIDYAALAKILTHGTPECLKGQLNAT